MELPNGGTPLVANNLAWVLANYQPVDLNQALALSDAVIAQDDRDAAPAQDDHDAAIARAARHLTFRGTRGHILAKLGRHKEALPDLEASLDLQKLGRPVELQTYRQLAETCAALDMKADAERYKRR